jgi:dTDP-4-amino-4,6-dideoxygalactose transaminase
MPVHQMGLPCDLSAVLAVAARHNLPVVEDAACASGSEVRIGGRWERIGKPHGTVACFSFHPRKVITTGDGGMLTTADPELDRKFRLLRQHAMSVPDTVRHSARKVIFEEYPLVGFNYRMTDIQAAVGRVQLRRLPEILARRRELAGQYARILEGIPGLEAPHVPDDVRTNYQSYPVRVTPEYPLGRDALMQMLLDEGISSKRGIMNAHQEAPYVDPSRPDLTESEQARDGVVLLPLYPEMTAGDLRRVADVLARPLGTHQGATIHVNAAR